MSATLTVPRPSAGERRRAFRDALASGRLVRMPGAFSPLVAMAVEDAGFDGVYVSGAALYERVSARRPELRKRFVFMTGGLFTDEIIAGTGGSSVARLEKPFSPADIAAVIERVSSQI